MLVIVALGALLHFLYELSGCNKVVAIFAAVNESTWEHIKIDFVGIIRWLYLRRNPNYFVAKLLSLLAIIALIPSILHKIYPKSNFMGRYNLFLLHSNLLSGVF